MTHMTAVPSILLLFGETSEEGIVRERCSAMRSIAAQVSDCDRVVAKVMDQIRAL